MEIKDNIVFFESDEEFTDFCVAPYARLKGEKGVGGDYSEMYKEYLQKGMIFIIKDEDSVVYKRECVVKRVPVIMEDGSHFRPDRYISVQLHVENLEEYFSDLYD